MDDALLKAFQQLPDWEGKLEVMALRAESALGESAPSPSDPSTASSAYPDAESSVDAASTVSSVVNADATDNADVTEAIEPAEGYVELLRVLYYIRALI